MRRFFAGRAWLLFLLVSLGITGLVLVLYFTRPAFTEILETKSLDLRFLYRGAIPSDKRIALAVIDEKSLDRIGKWPWPRTVFARLVAALDRSGVRVAAFDVGFFEPDPNAAARVLQAVRKDLETRRLLSPPIEEVLDAYARMADPDRVLAQAIRAARMRVVLGYFFHATPGEAPRVGKEEFNERIRRIRGSAYRLIKYRSPEARKAPLITMYLPEPDIPVLTRVAYRSGYFNIFPDRDGVVRWLPMVLRCGRYLFPSLSVQAVSGYLGRSLPRLTISSYGVESLRIGDIRVPTDELGRMLIPYVGPRGSFPYYSISDILEGSVPSEALKDRIVLIGATAVGLYDLRVSPFSSSLPGLEIHASAIDGLLNRRFLIRPEWLALFDILLILFVGVVLGGLLSRFQAVGGALCSTAFLAGYLAFAQYMFAVKGVWLSIVYPALNLVLIYTTITVIRYFREERERRKVKHAFDHYLTASVVNEVLKHPDRLKLGGDKKNLTVMFSDIRGFTTISESLTPEELVQLLNRYLSLMTDIVFEYEGTLDKYIGDAIMAIWGAPLRQEDHPYRACAAALEMVEALARLQPMLDEMRVHRFRIGIGINTGDMVVGNMGSDRRFDYTVMGDSVNLASRLEGTNKQYGTSIILSESTHERVRDRFVCRELDRIRVKGKTRPITIYELRGRADGGSEEGDLVERFHEALEWYRKRDFDRALAAFEKLLKDHPEDGPCRVYIERCRAYRLDPPGPEWDGVYTMTQK